MLAQKSQKRDKYKPFYSSLFLQHIPITWSCVNSAVSQLQLSGQVTDEGEKAYCSGNAMDMHPVES